MRSRAIVRLTLKIEKNVKITEIDHNGACRRICEYFKTLFVPFLIDLSSDSRQKKHFKVSEKWRLFCFVLSASKQNDKNDKNEKNVFVSHSVNDIDDINDKNVFFCLGRCHFNENNVNYEKKIGHFNEIGHSNVILISSLVARHTAKFCALKTAVVILMKIISAILTSYVRALYD